MMFIKLNFLNKLNIFFLIPRKYIPIIYVSRSKKYKSKNVVNIILKLI